MSLPLARLERVLGDAVRAARTALPEDDATLLEVVGTRLLVAAPSPMHVPPGTPLLSAATVSKLEAAFADAVKAALRADAEAADAVRIVGEHLLRAAAVEREAAAVAMRQRAAAEQISRRLSEAAQAHAIARYHKTDELRALLMPDPERGDKPPIRLVSARWLLNTFKSTTAPARLEHRQALERAYGDAPFVHGAKLERVLAEVEEVDVSRKQDGSLMGLAYHGVKQKDHRGEWRRVHLTFPSATAMSHMCAAAARAPTLGIAPPRSLAAAAADGPRAHTLAQVARPVAPRPRGQEPARALAARPRVVLLRATEGAQELWGRLRR